MTIVAAAACGGSPGPAPAPGGPQVSVVAPAAGPDDLVVARVHGRPVWGSCVAAQVGRGAPDRDAALQECIAFELLAQEAEARGLGDAPEVVDAARTAMVSALVATFEDRYRTPAELGERMAKILDENEWRRHRPELRASTYVRVLLAKEASPSEEAAARAVIEQVASALADETGLFAPHLAATAERIAAETGATFSSEDVHLLQADAPGIDPSYVAALFAIPEVGRVSPPVRTPWGWDVILWTDELPAREQTRDELAAEIFPDLRRSYFQVWVNQIIREQRVQIELDKDHVRAQLEGVGP